MLEGQAAPRVLALVKAGVPLGYTRPPLHKYAALKIYAIKIFHKNSPNIRALNREYPGRLDPITQNRKAGRCGDGRTQPPVRCGVLRSHPHTA